MVTTVSCRGARLIQLDYCLDDLCSVAQSCAALCDPVDCSTPGFPILHHLPELAQLMSTELVMPSNHLVLRCPLLLLPSLSPSTRIFANESALCISWPKQSGFRSAAATPLHKQACAGHSVFLHEDDDLQGRAAMKLSHDTWASIPDAHLYKHILHLNVRHTPEQQTAL